MKLRELQLRFERAILDEGSESAVADLELRGSNGFEAKTRLEVYRYAYRARIHQSLAEDFSGLMALLGEEPFKHWVADFLGTRVSSHPDLGEFSEDFLEFLRAPGRLSPEPLFRAELDWASVRALSSPELPERESMSPEDLTEALAKDPGSIQLVLHPSVQILGNHIVWLLRGEVQVAEFLKHEQELFAVLSQPRSLENLAETVRNLGLSDEKVASFFEVWTRKGVVVPLRARQEETSYAH